MTLKIYQVDAFTDQLFGGNPAAVVPLNKWLPSEIMQRIAMENNLAETAFFVPGDHTIDIRWFTPKVEVELCGHATLASAHVLFNHLNFREDKILFKTLKRGDLSVIKKGNQIDMDFPADKIKTVSAEESRDLANALDISPIEGYRGSDDYLVILRSEENVVAFNPDFLAIKKLAARGIIISAPGSTSDFVSRCFFPRYGIDEDPVTGSAHTLLTPYWSNRLGKTRLSAIQASERAGHLLCEVRGERVILTGSAVTYMTGEINIPHGL